MGIWQVAYSEAVQQKKRARQDAYLQVLAVRGTITSSLKIAGVSDYNLGYWRRNEDGFKEREAAARTAFADTLVDEAVIRARDGWQEPVIYQGEQRYLKDPTTGEVLLDDNLDPVPLTVLKKSDQLMVKMLEANVPGYQRGTNVNVHGVGGGAGGVPSKITIEFVEPDGDE